MGKTKYTEGKGTTMMVCGILSSVACTLVMLALYVRPKERKNKYMEIVSYITACELLAAIGGALGSHQTESVSCWTQALLTNIFPIAGGLWVIVLYIQLYFSLSNTYTLKQRRQLPHEYHIICWGLPIILSLLPLSTDTYGIPPGGGWCFIVDTKQPPAWTETFWRIAAFYFWLLAILLAMLYFYMFIVRYVRIVSGKSSLVGKFTLVALSKLKYYGLIIVFGWGIIGVLDISDSISPGAYSWQNGALDNLSSALALLTGFFGSLVFFVYNPDIFKGLVKIVIKSYAVYKYDCKDEELEQKVSDVFKRASRSEIGKGEQSITQENVDQLDNVVSALLHLDDCHEITDKIGLRIEDLIAEDGADIVIRRESELVGMNSEASLNNINPMLKYPVGRLSSN